MKLNWVDDPQLESHLSSLGISWTRQDVPLNLVNVEASKENNARLDKPLCEETALEYACAFTNGAKFPSVALHRNGSPQYMLIAGNHRTGGVVILRENGDITADEAVLGNAYVINSDDKMLLELVTRASNRWQGRRQGKNEALEHVRWMMRKYNMDIVDLSKQFFLPIKWLKDKLKADDLRQQLEKEGVPTSRIKDTGLLTIGRLGFNQKIMSRAAYLAEQFKLSNEAIKLMVDSAKTAGQEGEQQAIAKLKEYETTCRAATIKTSPTTSTIVAKRPVRAKFYQYINSLHRFLMCGNKGKEFDRMESMQITDIHDRHQAHEIWKQLKKKLDTVFHESRKGS